MTEINFTSRFVAITDKEFSQLAKKIGKQQSVNYPWTLKESVLAQDTYTKGVCDCTACLISDGEKSLLMHLCPTTSSNNHSQYAILEFLRSKINLNNENLQAVLIGSKKDKKSQSVYTNLQELLKRLNIPASELKIGKGSVNLAYRSDTDELYITNRQIEDSLKKGLNNRECIESGFEKISITDYDEI